MMAAHLIKEELGNVEFYLIVLSRKSLKEMIEAWRLYEAYGKRYIDGAFGLDCLEEFIQVLRQP